MMPHMSGAGTSAPCRHRPPLRRPVRGEGARTVRRQRWRPYRGLRVRGGGAV